MPRAGPRRGRGAHLWAYLTALVLIPLVGVAALTGAIVRERTNEADTAARAESAVRSVAQLDSARSSVMHEIVPALTLGVLEDQALGDTLGIPASVLRAQLDRTLDDLRAARAATDTALGTAPAGPVAGTALVQARATVTALRADGCDHAQGYLLARPMPPGDAVDCTRPLTGAGPA